MLSFPIVRRVNLEGLLGVVIGDAVALLNEAIQGLSSRKPFPVDCRHPTQW